MKWQPTPVLLLEKSHGRRGLVGYSPWGRKESDTTERHHFHFHKGPLHPFPFLVQSLSHAWLFAIPWTVARQVPLSSIISQSLLKRAVSFTNSLTHSFIHSFLHSLIPSLIHSFSQKELNTHHVHRMPPIPSSLLLHTLHLHLTKHKHSSRCVYRCVCWVH